MRKAPRETLLQIVMLWGKASTVFHMLHRRSITVTPGFACVSAFCDWKSVAVDLSAIIPKFVWTYRVSIMSH